MGSRRLRRLTISTSSCATTCTSPCTPTMWPDRCAAKPVHVSGAVTDKPLRRFVALIALVFCGSHTRTKKGIHEPHITHRSPGSRHALLRRPVVCTGPWHAPPHTEGRAQAGLLAVRDTEFSLAPVFRRHAPAHVVLDGRRRFRVSHWAARRLSFRARRGTHGLEWAAGQARPAAGFPGGCGSLG